jgi:hypothetical protein
MPNVVIVVNIMLLLLLWWAMMNRSASLWKIEIIDVKYTKKYVLFFNTVETERENFLKDFFNRKPLNSFHYLSSHTLEILMLSEREWEIYFIVD